MGIVYSQSQFNFVKFAGVDAGNNTGWNVTGWDEYEVVTEIPEEHMLLSAYPNPFNASTTITFSVPVQSHIDLSVYNLQGQKVATLASGNYQPGVYQAHTGDALSASGVYFIRLSVDDNQVTVRKAVLLK